MAMLDENVFKKMHFPLKIRRILLQKFANGGGDLFEVVTVCATFSCFLYSALGLFRNGAS